MAIPFSKYVSIISGVGAGGGVRRRDLIGRIFTGSPLISPDTVLEFTNATDVATYFGSASDEAKRANFYFGWISPAISAARKISFARFAGTAIAPAIYGNTDAKNLTTLKTVTAGSLSFLIGGASVVVSGLSFAAAASLADVAAAVQTALNANANLMLKTATVTYDATTRRFIITGGVVGAGTMTLVNVGGATDPAALMGLYASASAIYTIGADNQTSAAAVAASANISDNFGSFIVPGLTDITDIVNTAQWNASQNVKYQMHVQVTADNAIAWAAALAAIGGVGLTAASINNPTVEYPEMVPMIQLAATDYTKRASVSNYMFKQFALTPSVQDGTLSDTYDNARVNYYGRTQTAGQTLDFYQRGKLMGTTADPVDMNVYANEQWLKDACGADIMAWMLAMPVISANDSGRAGLLTVLQQDIDAALLNGTISIGKPLSAQQKLFISQQTGDDLAWHQVQGVGYWINAVIEAVAQTNGTVDYKITYTLIYSKDDAIRSVSGTHVLI